MTLGGNIASHIMSKGQRDEHREKVSPEGDGTSNSSRDDINNDPEHMANAHLPLPKTADEFEDLEVDEATERKILAKLDRRIIPMVGEYSLGLFTANLLC